MPILVRMNAIHKAIETVGSQEKLAAQLGIKQPTVSEWARGERPVPVARCIQIERATNGVVSRKDLRPDDWQRYWPEPANGLEARHG